MTDRPSKDAYYMGIATAVAARGTCSRAKVGAIVVKGDVMVASGYNGAPRGARHCEHDNGGDMENGHCSRAVHAETNAIANAARHGAVVVGGTLYCTATPCYRCAPLVIQAGIVRVVIGASYRPDERAFKTFAECGVVVEHLDKVSIVFVINGHEQTEEAGLHQPLSALRNQALANAKRDVLPPAAWRAYTGLPPETWIIYDSNGAMIDPDRTVSSLGLKNGARLTLTLPAGVGG